MDALKALAAQQGCSADGTTATRNPLSKLVNQVGKDGVGRSSMNPRQQSGDMAMHNAMAAGMGMAPNQMHMSGNMNHQAGNFLDMNHAANPKFAPHEVMGQMQMPGDNWVHQFDSMNVNSHVNNQMPMHQMNMNQNHLNMHQHQMPMMPMQYNNQMTMPMRPMMHQYQQQRPMNSINMNSMYKPQPQVSAPVVQIQESAPEKEAQNDVVDSDAIRKATEDLVNVMSSDEKFRNSNFYQEMSKVAKGDSVIDDNMIKQVRESNMSPEQQYNIDRENQANVLRSAFETAYDQQMAGEDIDIDYDKIISDAYANNPSIFEDVWKNNSIQEYNNFTHESRTYELQQNNKFADQGDEDHLFELGMDLFRKGELKDAILAFEAVVGKDLSNSEAWRMMGVVHQELDEDRKAIVCLETALEQDAYNLNALLELGVSYVNELDQSKALSNLKSWVKNNPKFSGLEVDDIYGDGNNDLMHDVTMLMTQAEQFAPEDPDVKIVLGVLFNVSRDYDQAVRAFKSALVARPNDYSLWNKLGATLANSSKSKEALPAYTRAIELKPRYARGWLNYGISHSNLGDYTNAIRAYLRALDLNPEATHIWNYLRICINCSEGLEHLLQAVDQRNIDAFRKEFRF